jgi:aspartyl-tRNA(Asn)/glutamyl-tRNA(Gln) amidotransferase subunit A
VLDLARVDRYTARLDMYGIADAAAAMRDGVTTSAELTAWSLRAIERLNPVFNAVLLVNVEALAIAERLDAERQLGRTRGALHGLPIAHKDLFWTRGLRTTGGSRLYADFHPDRDATLVSLLTAAGCVVVAKTAMDELGCGTMGLNPRFGRVRHPSHAEYAAGGSSSGSAVAVASGTTLLATATDTGGSIRIPCAFCGVAGLQVTRGAIATDGVLPLAPSLDQMGWIARSVADCAMVFDAIARVTARPEWSGTVTSGAQPIRLGLVPQVLPEIDADVALGIADAAHRAQQLGMITREVRLPRLAQATAAAEVIQAAEAAQTYDEAYANVGPELARLIDKGRILRGVEYEDAQRTRETLRASFDGVWEQVDALLLPATPCCAPSDALMATRAPQVPRLARFTNVLGVPVVTLPVGINADGLSIGAQLVGPAWSEAKLLAIGRALEWVARVPRSEEDHARSCDPEPGLVHWRQSADAERTAALPADRGGPGRRLDGA